LVRFRVEGGDGADLRLVVINGDDLLVELNELVMSLLEVFFS
jgi:hypothetical protein